MSFINYVYMLSFYKVCLLGPLLLFYGCNFAEHYRYQDPSLKLRKDQYETLLTSRPEQPTPPPLSPLPLLSPSLPPEFLHPISLTMTEKIQLKDVLTEMACQAKVNLILDPKIQGGLHFQAYSQPFIEVIQHICELGDLRYHLDGNMLRIKPDTPYLKTYDTQFLNLSRQKQNRISTATDVFTSMEGYNRDFDNGSSTLVTDTSKSDFWDELEKNLKILLECEQSVISSQPNAFTLHKQGGIVTIFASDKVQRQIAAYLDHLRSSTSSQVLIEAKIVEVNLSDDFKSGINWHALRKDFNLSLPFGDLATPGPLDSNTIPERNILKLGRKHHNFTGLVSFLHQFGTVRTLSSPRLTVMNNHSAVLKVARNHVFFKVNYLREIPEDRQQRILERASSQIQTVPIGLVMVVHPTIDKEKGKITMALRPTISSVAREIEDPAVSILSEQKKISTVPEVQVRELDSVLQVDSGGVVIMGGLMEERSTNTSNGLPGADEIPFLGAFLNGKEDSRQVTELVIFLRATIIDGSRVSATDQRVYETFTRDPRPLDF
jgi:MSHA type pilus biogenesis protein MshL